MTTHYYLHGRKPKQYTTGLVGIYQSKRVAQAQALAHGLAKGWWIEEIEVERP
jgi:hypothetical protein